VWHTARKQHWVCAGWGCINKMWNWKSFTFNFSKHVESTTVIGNNLPKSHIIQTVDNSKATWIHIKLWNGSRNSIKLAGLGNFYVFLTSTTVQLKEANKLAYVYQGDPVLGLWSEWPHASLYIQWLWLATYDMLVNRKTDRCHSNSFCMMTSASIS